MEHTSASKEVVPSTQKSKRKDLVSGAQHVSRQQQADSGEESEERLQVQVPVASLVAATPLGKNC